jgi:hypothetical protein
MHMRILAHRGTADAKHGPDHDDQTRSPKRKEAHPMVLKAKLLVTLCGLGLMVLALAGCGGNGSQGGANLASAKSNVTLAYQAAKSATGDGIVTSASAATAAMNASEPELTGLVTISGSNPVVFSSTVGGQLATLVANADGTVTGP